MSVVDKIIKIANSYIGQQEIQPNKSFKDPLFLSKMKSVGWLKDQAWCSYFVKLVWLEAYSDKPSLLSKVKKCGTGGAMNTLENYKADKTFIVSKTPVIGSIVIFQEGKSWKGHAGIVISVSENGLFTSIEGNTNSDGSREGKEVAKKTHKLSKPFDPKGLNIAGFIHPVTD